MRYELKRECEDRPIFSGVSQDDDPGETPTQTIMERMQTPPLAPIIESSQLPRPQRCRRKPRWLEDYKLRTVMRAGDSQLCSPTG